MKPWRWDFIWQMLHYLFYWMCPLLLGDKGLYLPIILSILLHTCAEHMPILQVADSILEKSNLSKTTSAWMWCLRTAGIILWILLLFRSLKWKWYVNALGRAVLGKFTVFRLTCPKPLGHVCKIVTLSQSVGVLHWRHLPLSSSVLL